MASARRRRFSVAGMEATPHGWRRARLAEDLQTAHVYPEDDLRVHLASEDCPCRPEVEYFEGRAELACGIEGSTMCRQVSHNAMDGREDFETGRRRAS